MTTRSDSVDTLNSVNVDPADIAEDARLTSRRSTTEDSVIFRISRPQIAAMFAFMLCVFAPMMSEMALLTQYTYHRYAQRRGFYELEAQMAGGNASVISGCGANKTSPLYILRQKVQLDSSRLAMAGSFIHGVPAAIVVILLGTYSDRFGRKWTMGVPWVAGFISSALCLGMIAAEGPLWLYLLGCLIQGVSGSYFVLMTGAFSMLADSTSRRQRAIAITVLECAMGVAITVSQKVVGLWITHGGFLWPFLFMSCVKALGFPLLVFFIPETNVLRHHIVEVSASGGCLASLRKMFSDMARIFTVSRLRGVILGLVITTFAIHMSTMAGKMSVFTLYLMNEPFCWSADGIGNFGAASTATTTTLMLGGMFVLHRRISDAAIAVIGLLSACGGEAVRALASFLPRPECNQIMFTSVVVSGLSSLMSPAMRAFSSKMVYPDEQGSLFASISSVEAVGGLIGGLLLQLLYQETLLFMPAFVLIVVAGLLLLCVVLILVVKVLAHKLPPTVTDTTYGSDTKAA